MSLQKLVRVRDIMKTEFDRVDGIVTIAEALSRMEHPEVRCLVVNKRHPDDEFGMLFLINVFSK